MSIVRARAHVRPCLRDRPAEKAIPYDSGQRAHGGWLIQTTCEPHVVPLWVKTDRVRGRYIYSYIHIRFL